MARKPKLRDRVKVGRRLLALPSVRSMTSSDSAAPPGSPADGEPKTDELDEKLTRTIKAAYQ